MKAFVRLATPQLSNNNRVLLGVDDIVFMVPLYVHRRGGKRKEEDGGDSVKAGISTRTYFFVRGILGGRPARNSKSPTIRYDTIRYDT
eukprot:scaffold12503_cov133-Skeletonema_menzelii.AAC.3